MKNQLTCKVIMLLSKEDEGDLIYIGNWKKLHRMGWKIGTESLSKDESFQHLYLVSEREIKFKDWYIDGANNIKQQTIEGRHKEDRKIEATTNPSIYNPYKAYGNQKALPQIPQSFIEAYVKANGNIEEVNIELFFNGKMIKTRSDNTVIIHQAKTYTREEVKDIAWKAVVQVIADFKLLNADSQYKTIPKWYDKWSKENL